MTVQRPTPTQVRYRAAQMRQQPTNDLRNVASNQQYHRDTYRRPSPPGEAQSSRESSREQSPEYPLYHDRK
jgi:hypothetical protein